MAAFVVIFRLYQRTINSPMEGSMNCYRMRVRNVLLLALGVLAILPPYQQDGVAAPRYGAWSAPVNLGSLVNTEFAESGPHTSKDGRTLYFSSTRPALVRIVWRRGPLGVAASQR